LPSNVKRARRELPVDRRDIGKTARPTGAQLVYAALRHSIIVVDIEPGASLEEEQLCRQYKVSRTPVREALIRLASEGLVDIEPNRGAKVAPLQFIDVCDHYEAMDVLQPAIWHFAAVRRTDADLERIKTKLADFRRALDLADAESIILTHYDVHRAITAACHNRRLEKAYGDMLVDKLRIGQHAIRGLPRNRGAALAKRLSGAYRVMKQLMTPLAACNGLAAERLARKFNDHVREQLIDILSASMSSEVRPPWLRR
jgi:DNA-binding GntR family transcriptional regulator